MLCRMEVMRFLGTVTVAVVLMTSSWANVCSNLNNESYCVALGQTREQDIACTQVADRTQFSDGTQNSRLYLFCCLGVFGNTNLTVNYTSSVTRSFLSFIRNNATSVGSQCKVVKFIRKCSTPANASGNELNEAKYKDFIKSTSSSCPSRN